MLLKCKDCGKEISHTAGTCPSCGCKKPFSKAQIAAKDIKEWDRAEAKAFTNSGGTINAGIKPLRWILAMSFIGLVVMGINEESKLTPEQKVAREKEKEKEKEIRTAPRSSAPEQPKDPAVELAEETQAVAEIDQRLKENTERLKKYYASADQVKQASRDIIRLALIKGIYAHSKENDQKSLSQRAGRLLPQIEQQVRLLYASFLMVNFVKNGIDAQVSATGKDKKRLRISYALMSQPLVYKFQNEIKIDRQAAPLGFTQIIYTNGFDGSLGNTWAVDL